MFVDRRKKPSEPTPDKSKSKTSVRFMPLLVRHTNWSSCPVVVAAIVLLLGIISFSGCMFSPSFIKKYSPIEVDMELNLAAGLMLASITLLMLGKRNWKGGSKWAFAFALIIIIIGIITFANTMFGIKFGIDEILLKENTKIQEKMHPGISPIISIAFILIGMTVASLAKNSLVTMARMISIVIIAISSMVLLGHLWISSETGSSIWLTPITASTASAITLIGAGLFLSSFPAEQLRTSNFSVESRILIGFIGAFLVLLLGAGYTYRKVSEITSNASGAIHTQSVRTELRLLYSGILEAGSAQRSYLLTGEKLRKVDYEQAILEVNKHKQKLALLVLDNPTQVKNNTELELLLAHRIESLASIVAIYEKEGVSAAGKAIANSDGIQTLLATRDQIKLMDELETKLLAEQETILTRKRQNTLLSLLTTIVVAVVILALLFRGIRREIVARTQAGIVAKKAREEAEETRQYLSLEKEEAEEINRALNIEKLRAEEANLSLKIEKENVEKINLALYDEKVRTEEALSALKIEKENAINANRALSIEKVKAEEANHAKDSFLAIMSHEIRTPLAGMLGMLELLSLTNIDKEQRPTLDAAWDSGRGLLRIVNDILDWSKIEEGRLKISPHPTSIDQILREVINTYSSVASSKSLILWQHSDPRLSPVHLIDGLRLSQILNNLVSNAIKFTHQGEIEVRAKLIEKFDGSERIRFSVKDTGIGISKELQENLFQKYQQESPETARMYGGTGLGLAICRSLANLMDGEINLESNLGQGSTFSITITLPITSVAAEKVRSLSPYIVRRKVLPLGDGSKTAPLILAVDDHPINRDMLARQIRILGFRAETAEDGKEALRKWRDGRFAMIISDCHMPSMDGYTLSLTIRKIEMDENLVRIPILAWTANALAEEEVRCRAAGMDELLTKPVDLEQMKRVLAKWLSINESTYQSVIEEFQDTDSPQLTIPIDFAVLDKVIMEKSEQIYMLLSFQKSVEEDYIELIKMLGGDNHDDVAKMAHRIKGSSQMVGAKDLAIVCLNIEKSAKANNLVEARAMIPKLNEAKKQIDMYCKTLQIPSNVNT